MVFQSLIQSVLAEGDPGEVAGGLKAQEGERSLEGRDEGASQQQAAQQLWQEPWLGQQLHLQQHMQLTVTVFLKGASLSLSLLWAGPVPAPPSTPAGAPPPRPKEPPPHQAPTNSWPMATTNTTTIAPTAQSGRERALLVLELDNVHTSARSHAQQEQITNLFSL